LAFGKGSALASPPLMMTTLAPPAAAFGPLPAAVADVLTAIPGGSFFRRSVPELFWGRFNETVWVGIYGQNLKRGKFQICKMLVFKLFNE
jgi:hypothetical protein